MRKSIAFPEDKTTTLEAWAKKLLYEKKTTQDNMEFIVGTLISTTPTVWKAHLHYRALQRFLIISLKGGRNKSKGVHISYPCVVRELEWGALRGLRANSISPWLPPKPLINIWLDASLHADSRLHFQCSRLRQGCTSTGWSSGLLSTLYYN